MRTREGRPTGLVALHRPTTDQQSVWELWYDQFETSSARLAGVMKNSVGFRVNLS